MMMPMGRPTSWLKRMVAKVDGGVMVYASGANRILASAPMPIFRIFGGLLWLTVMINVVVYLSAMRVALGFTRVPSTFGAIVTALMGANTVFLLLAAFTRPGPAAAKTANAEQLQQRATIMQGTTCQTCKIFRPIRSVHCTYRSCNTCVPRHDHHSPWLNNCVGATNHLWFFLHLVLFVATLAVCWAFSAYGMFFAHRTTTIIPTVTAGAAVDANGSVMPEEVDATPVWTLVHTLVTVGVAPLVMYFGYKTRVQIDLIGENFTLYEDTNMRGLAYFRGAPGFHHPFTWGRKGNWLEFFGVHGRNWREPVGYTIMDLKSHPMRRLVVKQVRQLMAMADAGHALDPEQMSLVEKMGPVLAEEEDADSPGAGGVDEAKGAAAHGHSHAGGAGHVHSHSGGGHGHAHGDGAGAGVGASEHMV